ncbi:MAG: Mur ligase family protein [Hespellia sp.]|nr:Mur ligase family protein [Hespellia sp.]
MNYEEAVAYISDTPKFTKKNTLAHTRDFLKRLGEPQQGRKIVHIAGTNGKGSVCAYIQAMLQAGGKTTGLCISPHLVTMNERIVINGQMISDDDFLSVFHEVMEVVEKMRREGVSHPTFFEFLFGMAMTAFARADVEYLILETGLGGRLDATNSIEHPTVCGITEIGLDHTQWLGHTIEQIAGEKAGIIKKDVPVFYLDGAKDSNRVIEKQAEKMQAPCKKISKSAYEFRESDRKHIAFSAVNAYYEDTTWTLDNIGRYQADNAMMALEIMRCLMKEEKQLEKWESALAGVRWAGRMEEILPGVYVDGAHNISAIEAFTDTVPENPEGNLVLFSAVADKDYEHMIAYLCTHMEADAYVITPIEDKRRANAAVLGNLFRQYTQCPVVVKDTLEEAIECLLDNQKGRTIYCLGSLYLTGMIKEYFSR